MNEQSCFDCVYCDVEVVSLPCIQCWNTIGDKPYFTLAPELEKEEDTVCMDIEKTLELATQAVELAKGFNQLAEDIIEKVEEAIDAECDICEGCDEYDVCPNPNFKPDACQGYTCYECPIGPDCDEESVPVDIEAFPFTNLEEFLNHADDEDDPALGEDPRGECSEFIALGAKVGELVAEKNRAYGNSYAKSGDFLRLLYPEGIRPDQYNDMLGNIRVFDKQMRIATDRDALGESPWQDIAGYGLLGMKSTAERRAVETRDQDEALKASKSITGVRR